MTESQDGTLGEYDVETCPLCGAEMECIGCAQDLVCPNCDFDEEYEDDFIAYECDWCGALCDGPFFCSEACEKAAEYEEQEWRDSVEEKNNPRRGDWA